MPPPEEEKAINKAQKLLLEGTKIIDYLTLPVLERLEVPGSWVPYPGTWVPWSRICNGSRILKYN